MRIPSLIFNAKRQKFSSTGGAIAASQRPRRHWPSVLGLSLVIFWGQAAWQRGLAADGEIAALRELEAQGARTIEQAKPAFVFLEGGSGFLISSDGYFLTNAHVVAEAIARKRLTIRVYLAGGKPELADLKGTDPEGDVALLKMRREGPFPYLEIGDSEMLRPGDRVVALGDPFLVASARIFFDRPPPNFEPSASLGIVSAVHRNSDTYTDAIQVDVAVNRGNSGGPLLTLAGKVVGINGKIETRFDIGVNTGVGYAIPMRQVERFIEPMKKANGGFLRHGRILGVETEERAGEKPGLPVTRVKDGSHAALAGIQVGDLLLAVDGLKASSRRRFDGILGTYPAGSEVKISLLRNSAPLELKISLVEPGPLPFLGLTAKTHDGSDGGARIVSVLPSSPADRAGVQVDDIIVSFGSRRVMSHNELELYLQARMAGEEVDLGVLRGGVTMPLELKLRIGGRVNS